MKNKFQQVIGDHLGVDGVTPVTVGHVLAYDFLRRAVALIKAGDPDAFDMYRQIKYAEPNGGTPEAREAAYQFALEAASSLALTFYDRKLTATSSDAKDLSEDQVDGHDVGGKSCPGEGLGGDSDDLGWNHF